MYKYLYNSVFHYIIYKYILKNVQRGIYFVCVVINKKEFELHMGFIDHIKELARKDKKTIILPESMDERIYAATETILKEDIANIIIIGTEEQVAEHSKGYDITGATIIDPFTYENRQMLIDKFVELRSSKGVDAEKAAQMMDDDYMYFACLMCKCGLADGVVSGACHSTANTIRPSLQIIKTKPGTELVSTLFFMETVVPEYGQDGIFLFADCALNQNPTAEELAVIAGTSAASFEEFIDAKAKVALLSYSTFGSAKHDDVEKVQKATAIAKEKYAQYDIDGELQLDAAIDMEVAKIKCSDSKVAGQANVLVFPNLDAGNIGYKLVQRLGRANAYGPLLQGIAMPVNDLSRGCSAADIVGVVALTVVQAQHS